MLRHIVIITPCIMCAATYDTSGSDHSSSASDDEPVLAMECEESPGSRASNCPVEGVLHTLASNKQISLVFSFYSLFTTHF